MSPFDSLHPALQHHIVNSLGWSTLRPLQLATIEPVLRGEHAILLAPTAGGKTEAAILPVLSRMLNEDWRGLSVLYLCPIRALLNNLEPRLSHYAGLLGRRVGLWHGDIGAARKQRLASDPPDILLTTPESLEVMLISPRLAHRALFAGLRCVIVDEIHAFAGDDRGWHLLCLLERLTRLAGRELQRLGLSATVGNPEALRDWLARDCPSPRRVIAPPTKAGHTPEVQVDWVGSLDNAALIISRLHRGEKRLVFCDSRARVEELARALRGLGVNTQVSHSALSLAERRAAELAFSQGSDCVIVATSTLELGIDVGDLERVIQIDAPATVSAFLQRLGRSGRRAGSIRNCLFLATRREAFLQTLALLQLWSEGFVEPVTPPPLPLHIIAQQLMGLALQEAGPGLADWRGWLGRMPALTGIAPRKIQALLEHLLATGVLHADGGLVSMGAAGERRFGRHHFMALCSVFLSPPLVRVFHGRQELGEVHQTSFMVREQGPAVLTLGGRAWRTRHVDWPRRRAYVEPSDSRGRSRWLGEGRSLSFELCQAIPRVLAGEDAPVALSRRAAALLGELREEYAWVEPGKTFLVVQDEGIHWWSFAGRLVNAAIAAALHGEAGSIGVDDLAVRFSGGMDAARLRQALASRVLRADAALAVPLDGRFVAALKFAECLDDAEGQAVLAARYQVAREIATLAAFPLRSLGRLPST